MSSKNDPKNNPRLSDKPPQSKRQGCSYTWVLAGLFVAIMVTAVLFVIVEQIIVRDEMNRLQWEFDKAKRTIKDHRLSSLQLEDVKKVSFFQALTLMCPCPKEDPKEEEKCYSTRVLELFGINTSKDPEWVRNFLKDTHSFVEKVPVDVSNCIFMVGSTE